MSHSERALDVSLDGLTDGVVGGSPLDLLVELQEIIYYRQVMGCHYDTVPSPANGSPDHNYRLCAHDLSNVFITRPWSCDGLLSVGRYVEGSWPYSGRCCGAVIARVSWNLGNFQLAA